MRGAVTRFGGAKNSMIDLEHLSEEELAELRIKFAEIADQARKDEKAVARAEGGKIQAATKEQISRPWLAVSTSVGRLNFKI
jgi:hypothetical protein